MYQTLPQGIKVSISHSIKKAFKLYMESIHWDDDKYDSDEFVQYWHDYSKKHAAWVKDVEEEKMQDPTFQEELVKKVNEIIKNTIETEPTHKQIEEINQLVEELGTDDVDYCCKAEAEFKIEKLSKQLQSSKK